LDPLAVIVLYLFGIYHNYLPHSSRRHRLYPWCSSDPGCPRLSPDTQPAMWTAHLARLSWQPAAQESMLSCYIILLRHVKTWRHLQNLKYVAYCVIIRYGPNHS